MRTRLLAFALLGTACAHAPAAPEAATPALTTASAPVAGGADHFTGDVRVSMLFSPNGPRAFSGAWVTFEPGARTAWHSHPAGQTLVVTERPLR